MQIFAAVQSLTFGNRDGEKCASASDNSREGECSPECVSSGKEGVTCLLAMEGRTPFMAKGQIFNSEQSQPTQILTKRDEAGKPNAIESRKKESAAMSCHEDESCSAMETKHENMQGHENNGKKEENTTRSCGERGEGYLSCQNNQPQKTKHEGIQTAGSGTERLRPHGAEEAEWSEVSEPDRTTVESTVARPQDNKSTGTENNLSTSDEHGGKKKKEQQVAFFQCERLTLTDRGSGDTVTRQLITEHRHATKQILGYLG